METEIQTAINQAKEAAQNLRDRIASHNESSASVRKELASNIQYLKNELDQLEKRLNATLTEICAAENARLSQLADAIDLSVSTSTDPTTLAGLATAAHTELLVEQTYSLSGNPTDSTDLSQKYSIRVNKSIVDKWLHLGRRRATGLSIKVISGKAFAAFHFLTDAERRILAEEGVSDEIVYRVSAQRRSEPTERVEFVLDPSTHSFVAAGLYAGEAYDVSLRAEYRGISSPWSEPTTFSSEFTDCCAWKECPSSVDEDRRYSVSASDPRTATKTSYWNCTVVGDTALPRGRVTSWGIKVARSRNGNGSGMCVGVAPADIDQNTDRNFEECGWYIDCYTSTLWSGLPQTLWNEEYGPRKGKGEYVRTGDVVGVVMDTTKGELSFALGGVNLGVAFRGIPVDKPLVPCVVLFYKEDSVEIVF